nr:uncharacterized protein LOC109175267 [Ipomoea trifida]
MRSQLSLSDEDQSEHPKTAAWWWRTLPEFDDNGQFKEDISAAAGGLSPRLKLLREMQRLAFISMEGLDLLRHKLTSYKAGDLWVPVGGIKKTDMDIPPVITLLLVGLAGAGKSSLVNFMYSVLGRSGLIPFAQTSSQSTKFTTMLLEEHNVLRSMKSGFCVYDTRGLDCDKMDEGMEDVWSWMSDGVRHNQPCCRASDDRGIGEYGEMMESIGRCANKYCKRRVNCVMVVADMEEASKDFSSGDLKHVEAINMIFHSPSIRRSNENPILILTHGDMLTAEERVETRLKLCESLGISETTGAYDVACLSESGILPEEGDPVSAFALTEAVYRSLLQSDRTHLPKRKFKDWVLAFASWVLCILSSFFAMLANFFSRFGDKKRRLKIS